MRLSYLRILALAAAMFAAGTGAIALGEPAKQAVQAIGSAAFGHWSTPPEAGSTVKIEGHEASGSGVHIGRGYVVTAAHVMISILDDKKDRSYVLRTDDGQTRKAEILWINKVYDLALLRTSPQGMRYSALTCRVPSLNEPVYWRGNPLSEEFVNGSGTVASTERSDEMWKSFYFISGPVIYGESGGPVLDRRGRLVGIAIGTMTYSKEHVPLGIGMAVTTRALCGMLARQ